MKYYLAGPMTGYPDNSYPAFEKAARQLRKGGFEIISPHEVNPDEQKLQHVRGSADEAAQRRRCMQKDLHALIDSDGIILLPGWAKSRGACDEFECARRLCHDVLFLSPAGGVWS